jgi:hypothetical protein
MAAGLLTALLNVVIFVGILWDVGGDLVLETLGHVLTVPRYLVITVVIRWRTPCSNSCGWKPAGVSSGLTIFRSGFNPRQELRRPELKPTPPSDTRTLVPTSVVLHGCTTLRRRPTSPWAG